jgi:hypothetical protein
MLQEMIIHGWEILVSMDIDPLIVNLEQLALFEWGDSTSGALELFPAVWGALEALVSSEPDAAKIGLEKLEELNAARFSPLVAYVLVTRLSEPDLDLRARIVRILSQILLADKHGKLAPEPVRSLVRSQLALMRTRQVYALLQVIHIDASMENQVARLLNACVYAGHHLGDILADRDMPLAIRVQAVKMIGLVGYVDAIPALERILARLESRLNGQGSMPFAVLPEEKEAALVPVLQSTLRILRAP